MSEERVAQQAKEKELKRLNGLLALLAVGCLGIAAWVVAAYGFKAGTDDLFLVLTCLSLALLFAINPLLYAYRNGWFDAGDEPEAAHAVEHEHGATTKQNLFVWASLLGLTGIEVILAYYQIPVTLMLIIVMGLSIIKAALIVASASFVLTIAALVPPHAHLTPSLPDATQPGERPGSFRW